MNSKEKFAAFTLTYPGISRRIIIPDVEIFEAFDPAIVDDEQSIKRTITKALFDTGATLSVIKPEIVEQLGLIQTGTIEAKHGGGIEPWPTYLVNIGLPNKVGFVGVTVGMCKKLVEDFGLIIGMDIITEGDFSLTNEGGKTTLSFRHPSIKRIDYVKEANYIKYAGTGRNEPCPCKSGKKYKHCHGAVI